ncbi:hypothetical protein SCLCIDRAFT_624730 [Scleroderma citrinum Foug A]|uniref:Uncharacterized protein n=1 Tax=Scleroderma citrinum Foug A TaxID=1036808 RepID=A0A0C3D666_9AGAM|nr:hypothetical protein SCLCIDRAFT_624730 [Scleroderma citrinum Foug A]
MILRADRMKSTCWFPVDTTDRATAEKCHVIETSRPQDGNGPITPFLSLRYRRATVCRITGKMDKRCPVSLFAWWKPRCSVKRVKFTVKSTLQERVCSMMAYGLPFLQKCRQPDVNLFLTRTLAFTRWSKMESPACRICWCIPLNP